MTQGREIKLSKKFDSNKINNISESIYILSEEQLSEAYKEIKEQICQHFLAEIEKLKIVCNGDDGKPDLATEHEYYNQALEEVIKILNKQL